MSLWEALLEKELKRYYEQYGKPPTQKTRETLPAPLNSWKSVNAKLHRRLGSSLPQRSAKVLGVNHERICLPIEEVPLEQIDAEIREYVAQGAPLYICERGRRSTLQVRLKKLGVARTLRERAVQLGILQGYPEWNPEWDAEMIEKAAVEYYKLYGRPPGASAKTRRIPGTDLMWGEVVQAYGRKFHVRLRDKVRAIAPQIIPPSEEILSKAQSGASFVLAFEARTPWQEVQKIGRQYGHELTHGLIHQMRYYARRGRAKLITRPQGAITAAKFIRQHPDKDANEIVELAQTVGIKIRPKDVSKTRSYDKRKKNQAA